MPQGIFGVIAVVAIIVILGFFVSLIIHNPFIAAAGVIAVIALVIAMRSARRARNRV